MLKSHRGESNIFKVDGSEWHRLFIDKVIKKFVLEIFSELRIWLHKASQAATKAYEMQNGIISEQ